MKPTSPYRGPKVFGAKPLPGTVFTKHARSDKRIVIGWHSGRVHWRRYPAGKIEHVSTADEWREWSEGAWVPSTIANR